MTATTTATKKHKEKSDVDPLYERRRWRRRSTADFRRASAAANVAAIATRSAHQLPILISDSEDSSESENYISPKPLRSSVNVNGSVNANCKSSIKSPPKPKPSTRFRRAASRSLRGPWQGDGACDALLLASHLQQQQASPVGVVSHFAVRRHAVMEGIRERIAGLRQRAETAPGRLEWFA